MTPRIEALREYTLAKKHREYRIDAPDGALPYRDAALPDHRRVALRFAMQLGAEQPVILPGERLVGTRVCPALPPVFAEEEWQTIRASHYVHESGTVSNLSADWARLIGEGLNAQLRRLDRAGTGDASWRESVRMSICAVLRLVDRYAAYLRLQGRNDIADTLLRVPAEGAHTLPEALQSLRILHFCAWCEGDYHVTLGRFDQYMRPYYEADLAAGRLTRDEAFEWIEEFFLACNRDSDLYPGMQQGDNGQSLVLGGMTPDGADGYSELSEMCLRASAELRVIDPKINLRVSRETPLSVYEEGTRLTKLGLGFPQYENDDIVIPGLTRLGYSERDARDYVAAACWEFIIPGKGMEIPNIGAMPLADVVKTAVTRSLPSASNMDDVLAAVREELNTRAATYPDRFRNLYIAPSPYFSLFFDGCVENGRDISLGCVYNNFGIHGTGLATAADSLAAVEQVVFGEGVSPEAFLRSMAANFEGQERLRWELREDCPKMGNDDEHADGFACFLLNAFAESLEKLKNERGGIYRAGTGSAMYYVTHAENLGATPDGRLADEPLPANYSPSLCAKVKGPASVLRSFAKPDLTKTINGGPLTLEFHDSAFRNDEAVQKAALLVRSFIWAGGHQLQLNTVNRDTLLDAQIHPEKYRNLIVRVWGWSGYFVELDRCYQDHIIRRVEMSL